MKHDRNSFSLGFWLIAVLVCLGIGPPGIAQASFVFSHNEDASYVSVTPKDHELIDTDGAGAYSLYAPSLTSLLPAQVNIDALDLIPGDKVIFSLSEDVRIGPTLYADEDLLVWDGVSISLCWDGSANGLPARVNVDAVDIIAESPLEFSFSLEEDAVLPGAGLVADEDMVRFVEGSGFLASLDFDGSAQGVPAQVDLNAFSRDTDTVWILSFDAAAVINATLYDDGDLLQFDSSGGTFSLYFDASSQSIPEQVELNAMALPAAVVPTPTPTCVPTGVATWLFEPAPNGWTYHTAAPPSGIPAWAHASSFTDAHSIGLVAGTSTTTDYYGSWDNYINPTTPAIAWSANKLWRAIFTLSTSKASPDNVPSVRLRMSLNGMKAASYIQVYPNSEWIPLAQRPSTTDLALYMLPPITDNGFFLAFDLIDFDRTAGIDGSVYLEEVVVDAYDLLTCYTAPGWTEYYSVAGSGLSTWTHSSAGVAYLTDVSSYSVDGTAPAGLRQATTAAQDRAFGAYTSPTDIAIDGDKLYRATFSLVCENSQNVQSNRIRVHSDDYKFAAYASMEPGSPSESALPPTSPAKDYYVYFRFPTDPTGIRTDMLAAWDIYDFHPSAGGWAKLTEFTMEKREP